MEGEIKSPSLRRCTLGSRPLQFLRDSILWKLVDSRGCSLNSRYQFLRKLGPWIRRSICSDDRAVYSEFGNNTLSCLSSIISAKNFVYHLISSLLRCLIAFRLRFRDILPDILVITSFEDKTSRAAVLHIATVRKPSLLPREDSKEKRQKSRGRRHRISSH